MFKILILLTVASLGIGGVTNAATFYVSYSDAFSNTASLALIAIPLGGGVFDVTNVSGSWNSNPVTAGPVNNDPSFGAVSDNFYPNPAVLSDPTIDTGFVFYTAVSKVELYEYHYHGSAGSATAFTDSNGNNGQSGAVTSLTATQVAEPSYGALFLAASAFCIMMHRRRQTWPGVRSANPLD